jgi:putative ABC transport system ATP-binding protein
VLFELREVSRVFRRGDQEVRALDRLSLTVEEGEYVAITGPSGCGKTTLLNLLGLLDAAFTGAFLFRNVSVGGLRPGVAARLRLAEIGFVFQSFHLLTSLGVLDNVALPRWRLRGNRREARGRARELLSKMGLEHRLAHDTRKLSGGEMQRVAVARALVNDPSVVLADEPTANLDSKSTRAILGLFDEMVQGGKTLVVVSHDPEVVASAARVVVLRYGQVIQDIPKERLHELAICSQGETPWHGIRIKELKRPQGPRP